LDAQKKSLTEWGFIEKQQMKAFAKGLKKVEYGSILKNWYKKMENIINLKTFSDKRGNLTVIEKLLPFDIKRIFYIYGVDDSERGGHRHHKTIQAAICISGSCTVYCNNGDLEKVHLLDSPNKCLLIQPNDWHTMYNFSKDAILLVLASENYAESDYIFEKYNN
jgi:dTDP-4-dehydrorhamnose 3,5-epimerase-like enzyme